MTRTVGAPARAGSASGSQSVKVAPWPTPALAAVSSPRWIATICLAIASPSPSPSFARVKETSSWVNGSNRRASASGAIPQPVSSMVIAIELASRATPKVIFPSRLGELHRVREQVVEHLAQAGMQSPRTSPTAGAPRRSSSIPLACAAGAIASSAPDSTRSISSGRRSTWSLPLIARDTSSRSSTRRDWDQGALVDRLERLRAQRGVGRLVAQHLLPQRAWW